MGVRRLAVGPLEASVQGLPLPSPGPKTHHIRRSPRRRSRHGPLPSLLAEHTRLQAVDLERAQPFSWSRCLVSLFSYALLLSDVLRSGLGIWKSNLDHFKRVEPDAIMHFGPFAYPLRHLVLAQLTNSTTTSLWSYKFDTTSVTMRTIAEHLRVPTWSRCIFYHAECASNSHFPLLTVFEMIDSLVESVARHQPPSSHERSGRAGHLTVRCEYDWFDRLHHFAFPWFFQRTVKRTNQAIHYRMQRNAPLLPLCGIRDGPQPYACNDLWTRYSRLCETSSNSLCVQVNSTVWNHITTRMAVLAASYPNHTVDFVVLEGSDDYSRPALAFQGRRLFDVVTFARVRDCPRGSSLDDSACTTIVVDDYRYEGASMTINAANWFGVVALIRGAGQAYAWIRLVFFVVGTYLSIKHDPTVTMQRRVVETLRIIMIIPSQIVIYGSLLPIVCYVFAHMVDSAAVYELVALHFNSTLGNFRFEPEQFLRLCAVSMRSLWMLALVCHLAVTLHTKRSWSPTHGLPGIPEFSISFVASLTILAQVRSTSWRSTKVLGAFEMVPSKTQHRWHTLTFATHRNPINKLVLGSTIDAQCLLCSLVAFLGLMIATRLINRLFPNLIRYRMSLFSRTLVPFSARTLWLTNGLVVCWHGTFIVRVMTPLERFLHTSKLESDPPPLVRSPRMKRLSRADYLTRRQRERTFTPAALSITDTHVSNQLQRDMQTVTARSREVESMVFLVNLAVMTDPITFLRLRFLGGRLVGLYESIKTRRRILLPLGLNTVGADIPIDWSQLELQMVVNTRDLTWSDLLQCG